MCFKKSLKTSVQCLPLRFKSYIYIGILISLIFLKSSHQQMPSIWKVSQSKVCNTFLLHIPTPYTIDHSRHMCSFLHFFQFEKKLLRPLKVVCLVLSFLVTFDLTTASNTLHLCVAHRQENRRFVGHFYDMKNRFWAVGCGLGWAVE